MQNRAYSVLEIKSVDAEQRTIEGIATTPSVDRVGDIIDPMGAKFADDLPLLWQHRHDQPVGRVTFGMPTAKGIPFKASIPFVPTPGALQNRVDEAWDSVRSGLVRAVSIGFRAMKDGIESLKDGGYLFKQTEIMELSLVTIPANADAVITAIKAFDQQHLAHEGITGDDGEPPTAIAVETTKASNGGAVSLAKPTRKNQPVRITK